MISLSQARQIILNNSSRGAPELRELSRALNLVLAEDIYAREDLPFFTNSAMDGYAVKAGEVKNASKENPVKLKILGSIKAGDKIRKSLALNSCLEIFTGAALPPGADAVVMVENTEKAASLVKIFAPVAKGENVRFQGEEIQKGELAISAPQRVYPEIAGLLANLGIPRLMVYPPPRVGILVSGDEIVAPNKALSPGKVRDSNSTSLSALLKQLKITPLLVKRVKDKSEKLARSIQHALKNLDYLLITGGVSMGRYDLVRESLKKAGCRELFWQVAIRPGKPFYFSRKDSTLIFALPGNPASVIITFYQLVRPSLLYFMGEKELFLPGKTAFLANSLAKKPGRTYLLRGFAYLKDNRILVSVPEKQGSNQLLNFAASNCLVVLPAEKNKFSRGEKVEIELLPERELR